MNWAYESEPDSFNLDPNIFQELQTDFGSSILKSCFDLDNLRIKTFLKNRVEALFLRISYSNIVTATVSIEALLVQPGVSPNFRWTPPLLDSFKERMASCAQGGKLQGYHSTSWEYSLQTNAVQQLKFQVFDADLPTGPMNPHDSV